MILSRPKVDVVCLSVGAKPRLDYVSKLKSMLERHLPMPFQLHCIVDRPQTMPEGVLPIDASSWPTPRPGMKATTYKLGLYDATQMPSDEFLYFDTTLVIHRDLTPLLEFVDSRPEPLITIKDWNYDAFNTCVMRIRPGGVLQGITSAYATGEVFDQKIPGDQDFVTGFLRRHNLTHEIATFPEGFVMSYKNARCLARKGDPNGSGSLENALIVKFHGNPKMEDLINPWYRLVRLGLLKPKTARTDYHFWIRELQERWR